MKERTYLIIVTLIIIGLIVLGSVSIWPTFWPTPSQNETQNSQVPKATKKTVSEASASIGYTVKVSYPEFSNVPPTVNTSLKKIVTKQVNEFTSQVSESDKMIPVTTGGELIITYKVSLTSQNAISVWFQVMSAVPGMAHPNNFNLVYNYDLGANRELLLSSLFQTNSNYVENLSNMAKEQLAAKPALKAVNDPMFFINEGAGPKAANFQLFNLTNSNLVLIFNPGTVAPEFASTQTVELPWSQLSPMLSSPPVTGN